MRIGSRAGRRTGRSRGAVASCRGRGRGGRQTSPYGDRTRGNQNDHADDQVDRPILHHVVRTMLDPRDQVRGIETVDDQHQNRRPGHHPGKQRGESGPDTPATRQRVVRFCQNETETADMPLTQFELSAVSKKPTGVFAVTDENLAVLCRKNLDACAAPVKEERP